MADAMTTRLNVNINDECAASIQAYASAHGITVTEGVRHAISILNYADVQETLGHRLAVVDAEGSVIRILGEAS
jgi:hypothetical protein